MSGGSQYFLNMVVHAAIPNHFVSACEVIVVDTTLKVKKLVRIYFLKAGCQEDQHQVEAKFQVPLIVGSMPPAFLSSKIGIPIQAFAQYLMVLFWMSQTFRKGFGAGPTESGYKRFIWASPSVL